MTSTRVSNGFTLIEMLVVLAIVGILSAVAYPSYQGWIVKTRRTEAQAALLKTMQQQERYYAQHATYLAFSAASTEQAARRFAWFSGSSAAASFYELSADACDDDIRACVIVSAAPGTPKVNAGHRDPHCGTLTLTSNGKKSADAANCW